MTEQSIKQKISKLVPSMVRAGENVLVIVPDTTRSAPIAMLLGHLLPILRESDVHPRILIALGTHPPMDRDELYEHVGIDPTTDSTPVINHAWDNPGQLVSVGSLSAAEIDELSGGLMNEPVDLRVNRELAEADRAIIVNAVIPHELVGFSGGSKYLFPGISGPEMIDVVHWLGAMVGSNRVIGKIDTPSRRVLDAAALKMPVPLHGISFVGDGGELVALEVGELREAWQRAAVRAKEIHITYKDRSFSRVLSCCPEMYPDLWTGGKCVYKTEPVVADGGDLIVYAPHVGCFSEVHQSVIEALGYHTRDFFLAHMDRYKHLPRAVMAYSVIIKGDGTYLDGIEKPRINVSFASGISRESCEAAGIGYVDPDSIELSDWRDRESEGVLCIEKAGEMLYRLED